MFTDPLGTAETHPSREFEAMATNKTKYLVMHNHIINYVVTVYKLRIYWLQKLQMIQQHSYV